MSQETTESTPSGLSQPTELPDVSRVGDLELDQDKDFERHEWRAERIGWVLISLFLAAALLGLFSSGPLSSASAGEKGQGLQLRYSRFARKMAPTTLEVHLGPEAARGGEARVWFSRNYIEQFEVLGTTPEPSRTEAGADRLTFVFDVPDPAEDTGVTLHLRSERAGAFSARVGLDNGTSWPIRQYIYP